jgi:hypothetical protein
MKKLPLIILLVIFSVTVYAQKSSKSDDELEKQYIERAHKSYQYKKIYADVQEVKFNVKLAKDGTLKKYQVVNQYNDLLGHYLGNKNTLKEVETVLNKKGDALIKFTLLKCAARLALDDAAEKIN